MSAATRSRKREQVVFQLPNRAGISRQGLSRSHDPENGLHEPAVVAPAASGITRFAQTVRFHFGPLGVGQNESVHPEFESQSLTNENPESKQALGSGLTTAIAFWI